MRRHGKHKKKHYRRRKRKNATFQEKVIQRFPRLTDALSPSRIRALVKWRKIKLEYPPPYYDPWRDGACDPAEAIFTFSLHLKMKKLRKLAMKHGLWEEGERWELIKRIYLHWRSGKCRLGYPFTAYGIGHERYYEPTCVCGSITKEVKRFPRLPPKKRASDNIRFPRLPTSSRFWDPIDFQIVLKHRDWYHAQTGVWLDPSEYGIDDSNPLRFPRLKK